MSWVQTELSVLCIDGGTVTGLENVAGSRMLNVSQACLDGKSPYTVAFVDMINPPYKSTRYLALYKDTFIRLCNNRPSSRSLIESRLK